MSFCFRVGGTAEMEESPVSGLMPYGVIVGAVVLAVVLLVLGLCLCRQRSARGQEEARPGPFSGDLTCSREGQGA